MKGRGLPISQRMDQAQLLAFKAQAFAANLAMNPLTVRINGTETPAHGTFSGDRILNTQSGGRVENRECHFSILKTQRPEPLALGAVVEIQGERFAIFKVWGQSASDPAWSYRGEQWKE